LMVDVTKHKYAASHVGNAILHRLQKDVKRFSEMTTSAADAHMRLFSSEAAIDAIVSQAGRGAWVSAMEGLRKLEHALITLRERDRAHVEGTVHQAVGFVIDVGAIAGMDELTARKKLIFLLSRTGRRETIMKFDYIVSSLLSTNSDRDIAKLNPFIDEKKTHFVYDLTISAILHTTRIAHINISLDLLRDLTKYLQRLATPNCTIPSQEATKSVSILQQKLAGMLVSKRHFVRASPNPNGVAFSFDPRYLVFEFSQDILIRKAQIQLIDQFIRVVAKGGSMVNQMIMGAGKTTVVGPLLSLLLANGYQLVVQV
jgi:hypothetical protein